LHWGEPLTWNRAALKAGERRRVFCGSMCDVAERRKDDVGWRMQRERERLHELVYRTPGLDWLFLSKRPQNYPTVFPWWEKELPPNVWLGCTAGDQDGWDKRVKWLLRAAGDMRAVVAFVSCEPLLGPIEMRCAGCGQDVRYHCAPDQGGCSAWFPSWVIAGGESGPRRRTMELGWLQTLESDCTRARIPLFVKQDSALRDGQQGRIPDALWARKEVPRCSNQEAYARRLTRATTRAIISVMADRSSHGNRHLLPALLQHGTPGQRRDAAARIARALRAAGSGTRGRSSPLGSVAGAARALGLSPRRLQELLKIPEVFALVEKSTEDAKKL
jgi:protein gp37